MSSSSSETNKPYKCEECGETFNSQRELQEHNNEQHIGTA
jgi:predicted SprT family Zn-dependent metalloprotease